MSLAPNQTVILTGASRGIGKALALKLADTGVNLVLSARGEDKLAEAAAACADAGVRAEYVAGNAAEARVADKLLAAAQELGGPDGFIHAAGGLSPGPNLWEISEQSFDAVYLASVKAGWQLVRTCIPVLREREGAFAVFFGSGAAEIVQPGIAAYCMAKAAEEHMMRLVAAEAPEVACLAYRPHIVETEMQRQARQSEGGGADALHQVFRAFKQEGKLITPEQAADGLLELLAAPRSHHGKVLRWGEF